MTPPQSASDRLAISRERLRLALNQAAKPRTASASASANSVGALLADLKAVTSVRLTQLVLRNWWQQHPLRSAMQLSAEAAEIVVQPIAQTHPYGLVLGSALAGALLVRARPWRWIPVSALLAGLLPKLLSAMSHQNKGQT